MKKLIATTLAMAMALTLAACGTSTPSSTTQGATGEANNTAKPTGGDFPKKVIEVIVPFGAGGGADVSVRMLAKYAEAHLGQKLVISNVTGGSGTVGLTQLAGATPDGYKLGYFASTNSNDNLLFEGVSYTVDSFVPIVQTAADPHIIVASKKSGITDMAGLIKAAQAKPSGLTFGLGGAWTSHDFLRIGLEEKTKTSFKRMVFQGGAAAINAVAGGDCDIAVPFVSEALAQIEAGNVVPIAITSEERFALCDTIPTIKEEGIDFTHTMWRGLVAPAGTPDEIITTLSDAFEAAYQDPAYQKDALEAGICSEFKDASAFKEFYKENHDEYKTMIEGADLKG